MKGNKVVLSILHLLNDNRFYSVEYLAKQLNCSRTAITKALNTIKNLGINISNIPEKGYRCHDSFVWLNRDVIFQYHSLISKSYNLMIFDIIESTNKFLLNYPKEKQSCNAYVPVVTSEIQTYGRGRGGRLWYSGVGTNLAFSLRWRFDQGIYVLSGLSLVIGLAIVRTMRSLTNLEFNLKWPNDILFDNHKLAGVLIELRGNAIGPSFAVIGIGINFNLHESFTHAIDQKVTDLSTITGAKLNRNLVLSALLLELQIVLTQFHTCGFIPFKDEWIKCHAFHGKDVNLIMQDGSVIEGTVDGVNDDGSICLFTATGKNSYHIGDISLRLKPDNK